jgi:hypothetical protein
MRMANQVAARLKGDDYQHLYAWQFVLELLMPSKRVQCVTIEDALAGSVDDVTVQYTPRDTSSRLGANHEDKLTSDMGTTRMEVVARFYQVKYHVDKRGTYSTEVLLKKDAPNEASLLEKFWRTWCLLREQQRCAPLAAAGAATNAGSSEGTPEITPGIGPKHTGTAAEVSGMVTSLAPPATIELFLVSNWTWDQQQDPLGRCISGQDNRLTDAFFTAKANSRIGRLRRQWQDTLGASDAEFVAFARSLRFRLGYDCADELALRVEERMEMLGLKSDVPALLVAVGIVRHWVMAGQQAITKANLEGTLREHDLWRPASAPASATVYLTTIKAQRFDLPPDYVLDWRAVFDGPAHKKGHQVMDPGVWTTQLLPELQALEARVGQDTTARLIRARGLARLSAWFAFGFTFAEVAGYTIEVDQQGQLWRSDAPPTPDFTLMCSSDGGLRVGERLDDGRPGAPAPGGTVALGISVSASLDDDVRAYLASLADQANPVEQLQQAYTTPHMMSPFLPVPLPSAVLLVRPNRDLGRTCLRTAGDVVALADQVKRVAQAFVQEHQARRLLVFYCGPLSGACFIGHRFNAVCRTIQFMEDQQPGYAPSFLLQ